MFKIPELLDQIFYFAGAEGQMQALQVSTAWRASSLSVIGSRRSIDAFQALHSIEYGQIIEHDTTAPTKPTAKQIEDFALHVSEVIRRSPVRWLAEVRGKVLYFPARHAQLTDLPDGTADTLDQMDIKQRTKHHEHVPPIPRSANVYWLDVSQLDMNPYLRAILEREHSLTQRLGRWEVKLRSSVSKENLIFDTFSSSWALLDAIGPMHITQPPCRAIGIYIYIYLRSYDTYLSGFI